MFFFVSIFVFVLFVAGSNLTVQVAAMIKDQSSSRKVDEGNSNTYTVRICRRGQYTWSFPVFDFSTLFNDGCQSNIRPSVDCNLRLNSSIALKNTLSKFYANRHTIFFLNPSK